MGNSTLLPSTRGPSDLPNDYDTHDKELLAIFEAFKIWHHHLEGSTSPIDVFTDHKNLEYFSTSKTLTWQQVRWSEYLSAFNLSLHFCPGKLGTKPDALTRCWDVYLKEGGVTYANTNPKNTHPLFSAHQMHTPTPSTHPSIDAMLHMNTLDPATPPTSALSAPIALLDMEALHSNILTGLAMDTDAQACLDTLRQTPCPDSKWSLSPTGFLLHEGVVYIPTGGDLRTHVLKACHDHLLVGHPGQTKTLELPHHDYFWPKMCEDVITPVKSCITCGHAKARQHQPYGTLHQLLILKHPWHSISMDFIEQLPPSSDYSMIFIIVDRLTKQALFLPTTDNVTSEEVAQLYFKNIFSQHGVPVHITSDWGTEFVSHFFRTLGMLLGI